MKPNPLHPAHEPSALGLILAAVVLAAVLVINLWEKVRGN